MLHLKKKIAPEPYFTAYLYVMRQAILDLRMWHRYEMTVPPQQVEDLMDAIHNISDLLYCYDRWHVHENVREDLARYDGKWANPEGETGRSLCQLLERAIADVHENGSITMA